jgi:hypothetical protein
MEDILRVEVRPNWNVNGITDNSTGSDGLRLWHVDSLREIQTPPKRPKQLGQVTAVRWLSIRNDPRLIVCFGTTLGCLCLWRQSSKDVYEEIAIETIGGGKEILTIEADKPTLNDVRFAIGTWCGHVQVWKYDSSGSLSNIFAVTIGKTVPRKVVFSQTASSKSKGKTVVAYGYSDGQMYVCFDESPALLTKTPHPRHTLNIDNGTVIETHRYCRPV